jgi:hypothetical protein
MKGGRDLEIVANQLGFEQQVFTLRVILHKIARKTPDKNWKTAFIGYLLQAGPADIWVGNEAYAAG